ncbi:MAG TPA: SAM-dependent methyltransferase [Dongiaceae bacterium]|nr:SAM-dependent methyltransferase [Dongiaceae bacterium]
MTATAEAIGATGYLAPAGFEAALAEELADAPVIATHGRLFLVAGAPSAIAWAANIWHDPVRMEIGSIADGAKALRAIQRNWAAYEFHLHRRTSLIQAKLPHVSAKPLAFPSPAPTAPLGSWTLIDEQTILAAARCASPFANGEPAFIEDKQAPPNRAYLKLWEALTLLGRRPQAGERCLDLGSSPGGWSWVLQSLGAEVVSVDKAPLAPAIARLPRIDFRQMSAFALEPAATGPVDWLFSDIVCYPARLLQLVERWLAADLVRNFVCTLKFQGATDHATARRFAAIPGSRLMHLHHNKHELTWARLA